MHASPVGHRAVSWRFTWSRFALVPAIAVLLATPTSTAQAQFGKLKKIGADAIKDKAKEKIGGKEAATSKDGVSAEAGKSTSADSKPVNMTINASQLDLMLAALAPMAADAEKATQANRMKSEHIAKRKVAEKCMQDGQVAMSAGRMPTPTAAGKARAKQLSKDAERLQQVASAALTDGNRRAWAFAQDSASSMQMQSTMLELGFKCDFAITPPAVMEREYGTYGMSGDLPVGQSSVPADARATFTKYQFALLRERIALFAMLSADPSIKAGKQGVFTDEERAALTARMPEIVKLLPYFRNGTMGWKGTDDLSSW
ncbi:hypothetical protein [Gemmatimonas groenlandica]|uniref:DUF4142 domain-containing protein n=1 Tax=Gemmatimonas groenlandica TaxID=2732249 RepID=A0A6M4J0F5_9BACT|nr:hypothetical protein [Gemmatimonas groenlandica]QJR37951.1 hypothetical protein HKW67_21685 [Gemmatimonas groenlandica]